jgi:hypothetical protein
MHLENSARRWDSNNNGTRFENCGDNFQINLGKEMVKNHTYEITILIHINSLIQSFKSDRGKIHHFCPDVGDLSMQTYGNMFISLVMLKQIRVHHFNHVH